MVVEEKEEKAQFQGRVLENQRLFNISALDTWLAFFF